MWEDLAARQEGMLSHRQLRDLGVGRGIIRSRLDAGNWCRRTEEVLSTTTGPLSWEQRLWLGVLHAGPEALVGGLTATALHGMRGWERPEITVLVRNPHSFEPVPGIRFFRTRRPLPLLAGRGELPVCRLEPAVLLFAAHEPNIRTAQGALAAVIQQHLATVEALATWIDGLRPLRRGKAFRSLLGDVADGAQSLAEVDIRRACRAYGVAPPRSQTPRRDRRGRRRYTDCEWTLLDGRTLILEVDGGFHDEVLQAVADRARNRRLAALDRIVIQCSAYELRHDPAGVIEDLIALGVPRIRAG
ncbi:MAG: hypothetical protein ACTHJH_01315 [Marmoricola sp.]